MARNLSSRADVVSRFKFIHNIIFYIRDQKLSRDFIRHQIIVESFVISKYCCAKADLVRFSARVDLQRKIFALPIRARAREREARPEDGELRIKKRRRLISGK